MDGARLVRPDRDQHLLQPMHLDGLLPPDHEARMIWQATRRLDLSGFYASIQARDATAGRAAIDPRLLLALWLYAYKDGVGSGRALARLCQQHDAYRWLCGGVKINYHTLNDFRVAHDELLDDLLTQLLVVLVHHGVVTVERVSQDGTRVRASAGSSSFRGRDRLAALRAEMRRHVASLKKELDADPTGPKRALREAQQRLARVDEAMETLQTLTNAKAQQKDKPSKHRAPRASTTDPEARIMRMPGGGYRPAYNVQFATDHASRAIVGVDVTNNGSDANESESMRAQVECRTGKKVTEHLIDGGYANLRAIERAECAGVKIYAPLPKSKKQGAAAHAPKPGDGPGVIAWRARMDTDEAKTIYRSRAALSETINADAKSHRGMRQFTVRGKPKTLCVAMLFALTYNLMHFGHLL